MANGRLDRRPCLLGRGQFASRGRGHRRARAFLPADAMQTPARLLQEH